MLAPYQVIPLFLSFAEAAQSLGVSIYRKSWPALIPLLSRVKPLNEIQCAALVALPIGEDIP